MDGPYDANVPYRILTPKYKTRSTESRTAIKPKITDIHERPRSMLDDYSDRHVNKRSVLPDFTLYNYDGPMDVYCLMVDTEDERASTYAQIMKSKDNDK